MAGLFVFRVIKKLPLGATSSKAMKDKSKKIKVVIGVPVSDSGGMNALTAQAIGASIISAEGLVIDFIFRQSCDIVSNRTYLVNAAIKAGATHIFFVDCDMLFPHDIIKKLLAHKKEIVGVDYNARTFPLKKVSEPLTERSETELYKAKYAGMGVMLIDLSIFKDPKFGIGVDEKRSAWFNFGRDSQGALAMGEDAWFSNVARDSGFKTWIDPTIKVGHIGEYCF